MSCDCVVDVLVIFKNGTKKTLSNVQEYGVSDKNPDLFVIIKHGYKNYIPVDTVQFCGRKFDYDEATRED